MKIKKIKTDKITAIDDNILKILDRYIKKLKEKSIVVITSKIISISEGSLVDIQKVDKNNLIKENSDYYLNRSKHRKRIFTLKNGLIFSAAGIDESNSNNYYILQPKNPQKTANKIRKYLIDRFSLEEVGVIITDSRTIPFRLGIIGVPIAYSGFKPIKDYRGQKDIFGRKMKVSISNVVDPLAVASVLVMGEAKEQTPIAIIEDISFIKFTRKNPSIKELSSLNLSIKNDIYRSFFKKMNWKKGGKV